MSTAAPTVGSCWRGTGQDSWWRLLYADPAGGRWRALCLKAPDHYEWVRPGEERWLPADRFGAELVPLVGQLDQVPAGGEDLVDALDVTPAGVVPGLLP